MAKPTAAVDAASSSSAINGSTGSTSCADAEITNLGTKSGSIICVNDSAVVAEEDVESFECNAGVATVSLCSFADCDGSLSLGCCATWAACWSACEGSVFVAAAVLLESNCTLPLEHGVDN